MPSLRLTKTSVEKIALTSGESVEYFDNKLTGFGVRAGNKNRTYFVQCPVRGKKNERGRTVELKINISPSPVSHHVSLTENVSLKLFTSASDGSLPPRSTMDKCPLLFMPSIFAAPSRVRPFAFLIALNFSPTIK